MLKLLILTILAGIMMAFTAMQPIPPWTIPLSLAPLWFAWMGEKRLWRVFLSGWIFQFVVSVIVYYWIRHTVLAFFGWTGLTSWVALFAFSSVALIGWAIVGVVWFWCKQRFALGEARSLTALALIFTILEIELPRVFPVQIGTTWLYVNLPIRQLGEFVGFAALSGVNAGIGAALAYLGLRLERREWRSALKLAAGTVITFILLCALGSWREGQWKTTDAALKVHLLQAFIKPVEMLASDMGMESAIRETVDHYFSVQKSPAELGNLDLLIWPETAMPFNVQTENQHAARLRDAVRSTKVPLITGTYRYDRFGVKYNSAVLIDGEGNPVQFYDKHILMPFGEYLPGEKFIPQIRALGPKIPTYGTGTSVEPLRLGEARLGASICYEALFPSHIRAISAAGANIFLNLTGDSWFGPTREPYQHGAGTLSRAIEFRRPMIRVSDSGISSVITADGTRLVDSPVWSPWAETVEVPYLKNPPRTLFDLYGKWVSAPFLLALAIVIGFRRRREGG